MHENLKKLIYLTVLVSIFSCSPLTNYNRKIRSLNRYIERNNKKEQCKLEVEFKRQNKKQ